MSKERKAGTDPFAALREKIVLGSAVLRASTGPDIDDGWWLTYTRWFNDGNTESYDREVCGGSAEECMQKAVEREAKHDVFNRKNYKPSEEEEGLTHPEDPDDCVYCVKLCREEDAEEL